MLKTVKNENINMYLIAIFEDVVFVLISNKNHPRMPSQQCYYFETVSNFCQANNKNGEIHNGDCRVAYWGYFYKSMKTVFMAALVARWFTYF